MESSPSWLENIQCSPLWSVLLTANLLGSIYGLIDVTHLTSALSFHSVAYNFQVNCIWHIQHMTDLLTDPLPPQSRTSNICHQSSWNWNSRPSAVEIKHTRVAVFCFEAIFERLPSTTNDTTQWSVLPVLSVQGSEPPAEGLNPAQQLTTSLQGSTPSLLPSLVTAVILLVCSGLLL